MKVLKKLIPVLFLGVFIGLGFFIMTPTKLKEEEEMVTAWNHLSNIAKEPHESESREIKQVKEYLREQFKSMGVSYEEDNFTYDGVDLTNFLVEYDAPGTDEGVMFVSHFDSVSDGPGACDDGISVASILAAMKEIDGQELKNDLYFLFTDGEELMMYGAKHFISEYGEKYRNKVKLVLNFESRGTKGPLLMFETSSDNKNLVRLLQKSVPSGSTAFSFAAEVYKTMSNDTDLTEFLNAGYTGMNFAVVGGGENYHSPYDNMDVLNKDTAYMYVSTVNELVHSMQDYDLSTVSSNEDGVYFPIWKGKNLLVSKTAIHILAIAACTLFLGLLVWAGQRKKIRLTKVAVSSGIIVVTMLVSGGIIYLIGVICERIYAPMDHTVWNVVRIRNYGVIGAIGTGVIVSAVCVIFLGRHLGNAFERLLLDGLFFFAATIILYIRLDAFLYLAAFPLLVFDLILGGEVLNLSGNGAGKVVRTLFAYAMGLVSAVLFIPALSVVYDALLALKSFQISGYAYGLISAFLGIMFFLATAEESGKKIKKVRNSRK